MRLTHRLFWDCNKYLSLPERHACMNESQLHQSHSSSNCVYSLNNYIAHRLLDSSSLPTIRSKPLPKQPARFEICLCWCCLQMNLIWHRTACVVCANLILLDLAERVFVWKHLNSQNTACFERVKRFLVYTGHIYHLFPCSVAEFPFFNLPLCLHSSLKNSLAFRLSFITLNIHSLLLSSLSL